MRIFVSITLLMVLSTGFSQGNGRQNVKLSFLPEFYDFNNYESYFLIGMSPGLTYERSFRKSFNPFVTIKFNGPVAIDYAKGETSENIPTLGYAFTLGNKFFLSGNSFNKGFYVALAATYSSTKFNEIEDKNDVYLKFTDWIVKERIGYQYTTSKRFCWEVYSGVGVLFRNYYDNTLSESPAIINIDRTGLKPELGISIGYTFL